VAAQIKPGQSLYAGRLTLISYQASIRKTRVPMVFVMDDHDVWDVKTSTLRLRDARHGHECAWSFDGERMDLAVSSPKLAFTLTIQGGSEVTWADGGHGSYYSMPRLRITGSVSYTDERGKPHRRGCQRLGLG
jgi:hypothetical protein